MSVRILVGDALARLRELPDDSVHCVVTSPPYWGLRAYKGDPGMIGLEPTFDAHLANLIRVFREVRRALRSDGTLWLNYGDAYWSNPSNGRGAASWLKAKDLMLMPARVAMALQEDGWWLRSEIIWHKPNPMPESTTDRPTSAHEKLHLLAPSARYFYDAEAVRTDIGEGTLARFGAAGATTFRSSDDYRSDKQRGHQRRHDGLTDRWDSMTKAGQQAGGANLRNVWRIATAPYKGAHFATFPPALVEPCVKAGTSERGVCAECGAPWEREVERKFVHQPDVSRERGMKGGPGQKPLDENGRWDGVPRGSLSVKTTGWSPACECDAEAVPAVVLDPFGGAGTVGLVADRLQRDAILIEISPDYADMAKRRIAGDAPMLANVGLDTK